MHSDLFRLLFTSVKETRGSFTSADKSAVDDDILHDQTCDKEPKISNGIVKAVNQQIVFLNKVEGDGHCFFRSVAEAYNARSTQTDHTVASVRNLVAAEINKIIKNGGNENSKTSVAGILKAALDESSRVGAPRTLKEHAESIEGDLWGSASIDGILLAPSLGPILVFTEKRGALQLYEKVNQGGLYESSNAGVVFDDVFKGAYVENRTDEKTMLLSYNGHDHFDWYIPKRKGCSFMLSADRKKFYISSI